MKSVFVEDAMPHYIALHPFVKIEGWNPLHDAMGPYAILNDGSVIGQAPRAVRLSGYPLQVSLEQQGIAAQHFEMASKENGEYIRWEHVRKRCGYGKLCEIQRALHAVEGDGVPDAFSLELLERLTEVCNQEEWFFPSAGHIQPSMEKAIGSYFLSQDIRMLTIFDAYEIESMTISAEALCDRTPLGIQIANSGLRDLISQQGIGKISDGEGIAVFEVYDGDFFSTVSVQKPHSALSEILDGFWHINAESLAWWRSPDTQ